MEDKALGLLGLMRRAGAVQIGEDKALDAIPTGKVKLLLLSADASDRGRRRAEAMTNGRRFQLVETHYTREALGQGRFGEKQYTLGCRTHHLVEQ